MTTPPHIPPMAASNEAEPDQLDVARAEGDAYARALQAMATAASCPAWTSP